MHRPDRAAGDEPLLGGARLITGMEPAFSRESSSPYGSLHVRGLEAPPVTGRRRPLVVLVLLDESITELVQLIMQSNGYDVRCADDGEHAFALVRALEPNLLVSSLHLGRCTGLELIQQVRADPNLLVQRVPVLVMDVQFLRHPIAAAFAAGADDYVSMPVDIHIMLRAWRRAVSSFVRPAPLTAVMNEDALVRSLALDFIERQCPEGLARGLGELLWQPDPRVQAVARRALLRLRTPEAQAALERAPAPLKATEQGDSERRYDTP